MKNLSMKLVLALLAASCVPIAARGDMKARNKMTTAGMAMESTVYVKGGRQRTETSFGMGTGMGSGMQTINLHQCDLNRIVQINNNTCTYYIAPAATGETSPAAAAPAASSGPRRGGHVTVISDVTDTGERQQMFGHTARHLKIRMTTEASPNSCARANTRMESDGWYIDVAPALDCAIKGMPTRPAGRGSSDCQDDYTIKSTGSGRPGFPIRVTTNIDAGGHAVTMSQETVELTSASLDPALFEIPAGYREVHSMGELMGMGGMGGNASTGCSGGQQPAAAAAMAQAAAAMPAASDSDGIRIGIAPINNKTTASFSADQVRGKLIELFDGMNSIKVEAIPLDSRELPDLDREARQKQCSYILVTNVNGLKEPSAKRKLGGFLGRAAGVPTNAGTFESSIDYHLYQVGKASAVLDSTSESKEGGDAEDSIGLATTREVSLVMGLVRAQSRR